MTKLMWNRDTGDKKVFEDTETPGPEYIDHHPAATEKDTPATSDPTPANGDSVLPPEKDTPATSDPTPANGDSVPPREKDMTKDEIIAALKEGQIEFDARAKKPELEALLINSLKHVLAAGDVEFNEDESARSLYEKLQGFLAEHQPPAQE